MTRFLYLGAANTRLIPLVACHGMNAIHTLPQMRECHSWLLFTWHMINYWLGRYAVAVGWLSVLDFWRVAEKRMTKTWDGGNVILRPGEWVDVLCVRVQLTFLSNKKAGFIMEMENPFNYDGFRSCSPRASQPAICREADFEISLISESFVTATPNRLSDSRILRPPKHLMYHN